MAVLLLCIFGVALISSTIAETRHWLSTLSVRRPLWWWGWWFYLPLPLLIIIVVDADKPFILLRRFFWSLFLSADSPVSARKDDGQVGLLVVQR